MHSASLICHVWLVLGSFPPYARPIIEFVASTFDRVRTCPAETAGSGTSVAGVSCIKEPWRTIMGDKGKGGLLDGAVIGATWEASTWDKARCPRGLLIGSSKRTCGEYPRRRWQPALGMEIARGATRRMRSLDVKGSSRPTPKSGAPRRGASGTSWLASEMHVVRPPPPIT